ncbi:MAG: hypothetical protein RIC55_15255 [Pirellulaceae bacterium]
MSELLLLADILFTARALGIALWVGLAVLTISLLVLMRTRFGQAEPISKCVVLSVLAHVLLLGYAWGTRLIFEAPPSASSDFIAVSIESDKEFDENQQRSSKSADQLDPWERLPSDSESQPEIPSPERASAAPQESPVRRPSVESPPAVGGLPTMAVQRSDAPADVPPPPDDQAALRRERSGVEAAPLEASQAKRHEVVQQQGPEVAPLRRSRDMADSQAESPQPAPPDLPDDFFNIKPRMQRLADPVSSAEAPDVARGEDDPSAGALRDLYGDSNTASADSPSPTKAPLAGIASKAPSPASAGPEPAASPDVHGRTNADPGGNSLLTTAGVVRRLGDGAEMPNLYRLRFSENRLAVARRRGGDERTETAVQAALAWLAANQEENGRWSASRHGAGVERSVLGHNREGAGASADTGITGLAVLAFLGTGQSHLEGRWRQTVQHGLEYLLRSQRSDGSLAGDARLFASMYCHGMASLALSEAYAMTGDHRLKPFVERAVAYSVSAQDRRRGGWRYQPGDSGDMSQFGWQVMSLVSAQRAGVAVPDDSRRLMMQFLSSASTTADGALYSYRPGEGASRTMTAEGLTCGIFLQAETPPQARREAIDFLVEQLPGDEQADLYYWYYATLALSQSESDAWSDWNDALKQQLLRRQVAQGDATGSWSADTRWGGYGGRVYSTAMACLCLEVYYRYLPVYLEDAR